MQGSTTICCALLVAVQLPHQPGVPRVPLHVEDRICHCVETLIGDVDYWQAGPLWASRLGELLDKLRVRRASIRLPCWCPEHGPADWHCPQHCP